MTIETALKIATQQYHMSILEDVLLDALEQLKKMRSEHEQIMTDLIKENREQLI